MENKQLRIRQIKSTIGSPPKVKRTMTAIGFHHHYQVLIKQDTPQLRGMLHRVRHLVEVTEEKAAK